MTKMLCRKRNRAYPDNNRKTVYNFIKRLSNRKAPGIYGITSELIKAGGVMMITILTIVFNKIIKTEKSPEHCSKMSITPIHKKGDKLNEENYRAIALLSIPGKVLNKILMCRYSHIIEESLKND